jgi:hypothetical protein
MERKPRRPSPAMFVAMVALSLTLGGSAIAADTLSKKDVKKIAKKQAKKEIKKIKRAYATVDGDGTVSSNTPAKNIASGNIANPSDGQYCFDLPFDPVAAASNEAGGGIEDGIMAVKLDTTAYDFCPGSAEAEVTHFDTSAGTYSSDPFIIQFDGP